MEAKGDNRPLWVLVDMTSVYISDGYLSIHHILHLNLPLHSFSHAHAHAHVCHDMNIFFHAFILSQPDWYLLRSSVFGICQWKIKPFNSNFTAIVSLFLCPTLSLLNGPIFQSKSSEHQRPGVDLIPSQPSLHLLGFHSKKVKISS